MRLVKKIMAVATLFLVAALAAGHNDSPSAGPAAPPRIAASTPARADLAEAVFAMVLENAGLPLSQPVTLCQACVAAHLGLAADALRGQCEKACGLR